MSYQYFDLSEFDCSETGENEISPVFVAKLDRLRALCGFPFVITSGYRSPQHSVEAVKSNPGTHAYGIAADIAVSGGAQRFTLVKNALALGFTGIGAAKDFVHVDTRTTPAMWVYGN